MNKLTECLCCQFYAHDPHIICAVHPTGADDLTCKDFLEDPNAYPETWAPAATTYINDELVLIRRRAIINGEEVIELDLPSWHPLYTGKCPRCGASFERDYTARVHWDCDECGWLDDSI